jgi:hypothetical protein
MSTLIAHHDNGDLADVEFDFVRVTFLLPNRKSKPAGDAAFRIAFRDTRELARHHCLVRHRLGERNRNQ